MKIYAIKQGNLYYNLKTNEFVTKIHFATVFQNFANCEKIIRQWKLNAETVELPAETYNKLLELYNHSSLDLCLAFEFLEGKLLSFENQAQAFTKVNHKKVSKLIKDIRNELKPSNKWLDEYDSKAEVVTEPIREILLRCSENLGKVNLVDLPKVDKYLITKAKNN